MPIIIAPPFPRIRHTYVNQNNGKHKCSICNDETGHTLKYDTITDSTHREYCEYCEYEVVELHDSNSPCECGHTKKASEIVYSLIPQNGSNSDYGSSEDITIDDITWSVGANTSVTSDPLWRFGGKSLSSVTDRKLTSKTPLQQSITQVDISFGASSGSITVSSVTFKVYDKDPTSGSPTAIYSTTLTYSDSKKVTVKNNTEKEWKNCYYQVVFSVKVSGTKNKYVSIAQMDFWD